MKNFLNTSCYDLTKLVEAEDHSITLFDHYNNIYEVERSQIGGNNGITCYQGNAFISKDLPSFSKDYVAYHEYLHTQGLTSETQTNFKAGLKKPLGLLQTIFYSLKLSLINSKISQCKLAGIWKTFKVYFFNDTYEDLIKF